MDASETTALLEPELIEDESAFEVALVAAMRQRLAAAGVECVVTHGFGLDIAVFMRHPSGQPRAVHRGQVLQRGGGEDRLRRRGRGRDASRYPASAGR